MKTDTDDKDLNLTIAFFTHEEKFMWWDNLIYNCKIYSNHYKTGKAWTNDYIASKVKQTIKIKSENGERVMPSSRYLMKLSTKWSKKKIDEAVWHFVDNIIQYRKGKNKIKWEYN